MKLYKKNNKIYVDYSLGAERIRKSLKLEWNKTNLNYVRSEVIPKLLKQTEYCKEYTLYELLDMLLEQVKIYKKPSTVYSLITLISTTKKYITDKNISKYLVRDIENIVLTMYKNGYASGSIKNSISILKRAFDLGIKLGVISFNPVFKIEIPNRKKVHRIVYSKDQVKSLLEQSKGELNIFLYLALYTGARPGEILALTKEDIYEEYLVINKTLAINAKGVQTPKTGKTRKVFIPDILKDRLKDFKKFHKGYFTFVKQFQQLCKDLSVPYAGLHSLRHTYASILMNDRIDPLVIKELLGHQNLKMLENVYGHFLGYNETDKTDIKSSLNYGLTR